MIRGIFDVKYFSVERESQDQLESNYNLTFVSIDVLTASNYLEFSYGT